MQDARDQIIHFLTDIGLAVRECSISEETFLPGITVVDQTIHYDVDKLLYPGELLHEAGHLAVLSPAERAQCHSDFSGHDGYEMAAMAWSYAACLHLGLPLRLLFHPEGYKGDAEWLSETYQAGTYIGLPILEWKGMASSEGPGAYPEMLNWLCTQDIPAA